MYKENLKLVIDYLEGKIDIYKEGYEKVVRAWDQAWDEMHFMGYNPQIAKHVEEYIEKEL